MLYIYAYICILYASEVKVEIYTLTLDFTIDESRKGRAENFVEE